MGARAGDWQNIALEEPDLTPAADALLFEGIYGQPGLHLLREPLALVDSLGDIEAALALVVEHTVVVDERLEVFVSGDQDGVGGGLINAARFETHVAGFD